MVVGDVCLVDVFVLRLVLCVIVGIGCSDGGGLWWLLLKLVSVWGGGIDGRIGSVCVGVWDYDYEVLR